MKHNHKWTEHEKAAIMTSELNAFYKRQLEEDRHEANMYVLEMFRKQRLMAQIDRD